MPLTNITQRLANIENSNLENRIFALESALPKTSDNISDHRSTINNNSLGKTTLFGGDTNLNNIKTTDLHKMCALRTLCDSNTDLIKSWVEERTSWVPEKCIIYSGLFDAKQSKTPSKIIYDLSALVSSLRAKTENLQIYILLFKRHQATNPTLYKRNLTITFRNGPQKMTSTQLTLTPTSEWLRGKSIRHVAQSRGNTRGLSSIGWELRD